MSETTSQSSIAPSPVHLKILLEGSVVLHGVRAWKIQGSTGDEEEVGASRSNAVGTTGVTANVF